MQQEQGNYVIFRHIFISWVIFSILYLIAAYHKPFHVDEFYSWVYTERCSLNDILTLKEFGIGHPPLYHSLQKLVQTCLHPYHPIHVRLSNYFIGSLFVVLFVWFTLKQKYIPFFCYGVAGSATILEIFIFSRMYGLVCLASLMLLWSGEEYCKNHKRIFFLIFIGSCVLGFISDYSFIVLGLYFVIVLFWRKTYLKYSVYLYFTLLFTAFVLSMFHVANKKGMSITHVLYDQMRTLVLLVLKTFNVLFDFWFFEPLLISFLIFGVLCILEIFRRNNPDKINIIFPFNYLSATVFFLKEKAGNIFDVRHDYNRVFLVVTTSLLIILTINPLFWTRITLKRFLTILCPFLLLIIFRYFNKKALYILSVILFCSGLIFSSSNRVDGIYPPPSFDEDIPVIYQNEWAYATQYLCSRRRLPDVPFITDLSSFECCPICKMGTSDIPFHKFNKLRVVWSSRSDPDEFIPADFARTHEGEPNLTWLDRLQFKYLIPLPKKKYLVFKYQRISDINK